MHTVLRLTIASLCLALSAHSAALEHEGAVWASAALKGPIGSRESGTHWQYRVNGEYRAFEALDGAQEGILGAGIGYRLNDSFRLWGGYARHRTHLDGRYIAKEHRVWQALQWSANLDNGWDLSTRSKLEQRFFEGREKPRWRFRQAVKLSAPLENHSGVNWIVAVEPFIQLYNPNGSTQGLVQNRTFIGLGLRSNRHTKMEVGYLNQWLRNRRGEDLVNHILQLKVNFSP